MAGFSRKLGNHHHIGSLSFPARSQPPIAIKIEDELNKLRSLEMSLSSSSSKAELIRAGLYGLCQLHRYIEDVFNLPPTQQALSQKWVNKLLDESDRFLDLCSNTRASLLVMKEGFQYLQSALRRRKVGDSISEGSIVSYISCRKKMKKDITKSLTGLKQVECNLSAPTSASPSSPEDLHLTAMVRVLKEASLITITVLKSLLLFVSTARFSSKHSKCSFVAKMLRKGGVEPVDGVTELEMADVAVRNVLGRNADFENVEKRLLGLDRSIDGLEKGLECLFRRLIQTRVSILNMPSH